MPTIVVKKFRFCLYTGRTVTIRLNQSVIFKSLSYCFEETIGFDIKASFARSPVSRLIKPGDTTKEF